MSKRDEIIRMLQNDKKIQVDGFCDGQWYDRRVIEKLIQDQTVTVYEDGGQEYIRLRR